LRMTAPLVCSALWSPLSTLLVGSSEPSSVLLVGSSDVVDRLDINCRERSAEPPERWAEDGRELWVMDGGGTLIAAGGGAGGAANPS